MGGTQHHRWRKARPRLPSLLLLGLIAVSAMGCNRDPAAADRLVATGVALAKAGETRAALEHFDRALRIDPEHPAALVNAGLASLLEGRPAEARDRLERYLVNDQAAVLPRVYLAHARAALDDRNGAIAALKEAVRLGFLDLDAFSDEAFRPLRSDVRFLQLASLVAQRRGQRLPVDDRGRPLFGDSPVRSLSVGPGPACGTTALSAEE
jgi:predicted Zn-dependent protease